MTVIAWDGKTLAADRQTTRNNVSFDSQKLFVIDDNCAVATYGYRDEGLSLVEWFKCGEKKEDWPEFQKGDNWAGLVVIRDGKVYEYQQTPNPQPVWANKIAWGAGADVAMGAMAMGADAVKAVEIASQICPSCGFGIDSFTCEP